jgi:hypothetical protein
MSAANLAFLLNDTEIWRDVRDALIPFGTAIIVVTGIDTFHREATSLYWVR